MVWEMRSGCEIQTKSNVFTVEPARLIVRKEDAVGKEKILTQH